MPAVHTVTPNRSQQQWYTTYEQAYNNMEISNLDKLFHPDINTRTWNIQSIPGFFCASYRIFSSHSTTYMRPNRGHPLPSLSVSFMTSLFTCCFRFLSLYSRNTRMDHFCAVNKLTKAIRTDSFTVLSLDNVDTSNTTCRHSTETHRRAHLHRWEGRSRKSSSGSVAAGWSLW